MIRDRLEGVLKAHNSAAASWRHPLFKLASPVLDVADAAVRASRGQRHLPRYSLRVRATGPSGQFGGRLFVSSGRRTADAVREQTNLAPGDDVLEIGCSVGRVALALADYLQPGRYTGMDIDREAIAACLTNPALRGFSFTVADVYSSVYNPGGRVAASSYSFPFPDGSFDVIYCASVLTHMLPDDISQYAREIARLLRPGGRAMVSAFVIEGRDLAYFPVERGRYRLHRADYPESAVAYQLDYFDELIAGAGLVRNTTSGLGVWSPQPAGRPGTSGEQDLLVYVEA